MIAGPSEIVVVADGDQDPAWIAADLLSPGRARRARAGDPDHRRRAASPTRSRRRSRRSSPSCRARAIAAASWRDARRDRRGRRTRGRAPALVDRAGARASRADRAARRGAGRADPPCRRDLPRARYTPEVIGDYVGGPNHVLPTGRTARFASGLAVHDFLKRTTLLGLRPRRASRALGAGGRHPRPGRGARGACAGGRAAARRADAGMSDDDGARIVAHRARQQQHRPLEPRGRARAQRRHLRPARGQPLQAGRRLCRALPRACCRCARANLIFAVSAEDGAERGRDRPDDAAVPARDQGLFPDLRQLFPGDQGRHAEPDRGDRHGAGAACTTKAPRSSREALAGKVEIDHDTARRLFTLVCVLHIRG